MECYEEAYQVRRRGQHNEEIILSAEELRDCFVSSVIVCTGLPLNSEDKCADYFVDHTQRAHEGLDVMAGLIQLQEPLRAMLWAGEECLGKEAYAFREFPNVFDPTQRHQELRMASRWANHKARTQCDEEMAEEELPSEENIASWESWAEGAEVLPNTTVQYATPRGDTPAPEEFGSWKW